MVGSINMYFFLYLTINPLFLITYASVTTEKQTTERKLLPDC